MQTENNIMLLRELFEAGHLVLFYFFTISIEVVSGFSVAL